MPTATEPEGLPGPDLPREPDRAPDSQQHHGFTFPMGAPSYQSSAPRGRGRPSKLSRIQVWEQGLTTAYGGIGLTISRIDQPDGMLIMAGTPACVQAHIQMGQQFASYGHVLDVVCGNMAPLLLLTSHAALVTGILANHGLAPSTWAERLGLKSETKGTGAPRTNEPYSPSSASPQQPISSSPGPIFTPGESTNWQETGASITPELYAQIQAEAERQAQLIREQQAAANSADNALDPMQNPAMLATMMGRRE